jgi:(2Fe-2S) ferredoxin
MTEMVERVARALCLRVCGGGINLSPYVDANWPAYVNDAHAAIEAMRDHTDMINAALAVSSQNGKTP